MKTVSDGPPLEQYDHVQIDGAVYVLSTPPADTTVRGAKMRTWLIQMNTGRFLPLLEFLGEKTH
jgi:hypothetical protein